MGDLLSKFCVIEEPPCGKVLHTKEEQEVMQHFMTNHSRTRDGQFVVPLPKPNIDPIGESREQTVQRFFSLERTITKSDKFNAVNQAIKNTSTSGMLNLSQQRNN